MISVIIPIAGDSRKRHLRACLSFLRKQSFKDYEIILIEQVNCLLGGKRLLGGPFYENVNVDKYLSIKDPGTNHFNQPWMANVGANIAKGDQLLFYDVDLVAGSTYLEAVSKFKDPYFIAWNRMFCLSQACSEEVHKSKKISRKCISSAEVCKAGVLDYAGFSVCVRRGFFFNKLGGYNENYLGWGGNDNDIAWRALKLLGNVRVLPHHLHHLWHPKGYSKHMLWERRDVWLTTYKYPLKVNNRLLKVKKGNPKRQTFINISDIRVDSKAEHARRKKR